MRDPVQEPARVEPRPEGHHPPPRRTGRGPEPLLALSDLDPDLLEPGSLAALFAQSSPATSLSLPDTEPRTLGEVVKEHVSRFGEPTDASRHLERFRLLRQGVSVR